MTDRFIVYLEPIGKSKDTWKYLYPTNFLNEVQFEIAKDSDLKIGYWLRHKFETAPSWVLNGAEEPNLDDFEDDDCEDEEDLDDDYDDYEEDDDDDDEEE